MKPIYRIVLWLFFTIKIRYRPSLLAAERFYGFENTSTDSFGIGTEHSKLALKFRTLRD